MRRVTLALTALLAGAPLASAQLAEPSRLAGDRLSIELKQAFPLPTDAYQDVLETTGDAELDALLATEGVREIRRIFRQPPRGWRDLEAATRVGLDRWVVLHFAGEQAGLDQALLRIVAHSAVQRGERVIEGSVADTIPDDPLLGNQWAWGGSKIRAFEAWDLATDSDVITAVLDTGTDLNHPDLRPNFWINTGEIKNNGIDDDGNGYIDDNLGWDFFYGDRRPNDVFGHGVHCQGTVGAVTNNTNQVAGVCWNTRVMSVKIFSDSGSGSGPTSAAGMVYAADNGAGVFSMSWGFNSPQASIEAAVDYAHALDVVQVAAAHNFGSTNKYYPAAYDKVMGIIATDESDRKTSWSNYGDWCSMSAPGNNIYSTYLNDGTTYLSGTSMSTPHVAGAAALIRGVNPNMDLMDTRMVLEGTSKDLGSAGFDINFGWGRLDLYEAVRRAGSLMASSTSVAPGGQVGLDVHLPGEGGNLCVLLPGRFGRAPGFDLSTFTPGDRRVVPLNQDLFLFNFVLTRPNGGGLFLDFIDTLDGNGDVSATFNVPGGNLFAGQEFGFAGLTFDPADLSRVESITCSQKVQVQ